MLDEANTVVFVKLQAKVRKVAVAKKPRLWTM